MILGKYASLLGEMTIAVESDRLVGLWFDNQKYFGSKIKTDAQYGEHPLLDKTRNWLDIYFSGKEPDFSLPLAPAQTENISRIREAMLAISFGSTISYSELAARAGMPLAVRAVAGIVAKNPFILVVPCHRIIGKNGSLTGYAAGLERKRKILELERLSSQHKKPAFSNLLSTLSSRIENK